MLWGTCTCLTSCRYLKTRRNVPQTCWMDLSTGRRIGDVSLAERIEALLLPLYSGSDTKFMSGAHLVAQPSAAACHH